jgi:hypothetical protein
MATFDRRRRRRRNIVIVVVVVIACPIVAVVSTGVLGAFRIGVWKATLRAEGQPVTVDDLAEMFPAPSPDQDAGPLLEKALHSIDRTNEILPEAFAKWPEKAYPELDMSGRTETIVQGRGYIAANAAVLSLIEQAASLRGISAGFAPCVRSPGGAGNPIQYTAISDFLGAAAWIAKEDGDVRQFIRITRIRFALADQLEQYPDEGCVENAIALNRLACRGVIRYLGTNALSEAELLELDELLRNQSQQLPNHPKALAAMRARMLDGPAFSAFAELPKARDALQRYNELMELDRLPGEEAARATQAAILHADSREDSFSDWNDPYDLRAWVAMFLKHNSFEWYSHYSNLRYWKCRAPAFFRMARTVIAIERYRVSHNDQLPESLKALVPEYLDCVPAGYFGDGAIGYLTTQSGYRISLVETDQLGQIQGQEFEVTYAIERTPPSVVVAEEK